jgi:hypothetical protein
MADHSTGDWASLCDDEELGHIDYASEHAGLGAGYQSAELCIYEFVECGSQLQKPQFRKEDAPS